MPVTTTIHLYGYVEIDAKILRGLGKDEINAIVDRECTNVLSEMKQDFWNNFKSLVSKES